MREWLREQLAPPTFAGDEDKTRIARWLYIILLLAAAVAFVYSLLSPFIDPKPAQAVAANCVMLAIYGGMLVLLRKGYVALASTIFSSLVWLVVTLSVAAYGSVLSPGLLNYFGAIAIAGLLLGGRAALGFAGLTILATFGAVYAEYTNRLPAPIFPTSPLIMAWVAGSNFAVTALTTHLALRSVTVALARARTELAERRRAEENLRASEERFRAMIENISDAIALVDVDGTVQYLSPAAERILGYATAERIGLSAFDNIVSSDHVAAVRQVFSELRAKPRASRSFELQARHKDGSLRWLEITATNLLDLDSVRALVVNYRDITARKQAEQALRESEELTRRLKEYLKTLHSVSIELSRTESLDDFFCMAVELGRSQLGFDRTGLWLFDRETMTEIGTFGTDRTGQTIDERDLRFPLAESSEFERILSGKQQLVLHNPIKIVTFSGDELAIGWIAQVALWDGDHVIGYISTDNALHHQPVQPYQMELLTMFGSTMSHLYTRKQAEIALRESEERFRAIAESSPIAITISQLSPEGRLLYANPCCAELYGYTPDKLGELTVHDLYFDSADRAPLLAELHRQGGLKNYDLQGKRADGTPIWLSVTLVPIQYAGQQALITALLDITERRKAEEMRVKLEAQLHQAQKMESIGRLAGGIAHDFNNLLTVIHGYCDIIQDQLAIADPLLVELKQIQQASARAAALTRQLLAFSRKQILAPTVLDLNSLVTNLRAMLARLIGEDITLDTVLAVGLRPITADPSQIEQVIMNLVVNARDAMPTGGRLTIETGNIDLDRNYASIHPEAPVGSCVMLAVTDTGCGMDAQTRARIFEPFFTTKEPSKGTGLGLATVYGIIKQSDGEITVSSEPGQGASFKIFLRASAVAPSARSAPQARSATRGGSETILLAEDEETVRRMASRALQAQGYTVLEARHVAEALALSERYQQPIDLLVTDVVMPQMSGRVLAERLTLLRPELKVLFMSGYMDDAVVRHGLLAAEVHFLPKPFSLSMLVAKVREVLDTANDLSRSNL